MPDFCFMGENQNQKNNKHVENGILYLKGGDLTEELKVFKSY
jgi:16S rRNA (guanine527-N7)-methyltransferase